MSAALPARISRILPIVDAARAERTRARIDPELLTPWDETAGFLDAVFAAAPYLGRLASRRPVTICVA